MRQVNSKPRPSCAMLLSIFTPSNIKAAKKWSLFKAKLNDTQFPFHNHRLVEKKFRPIWPILHHSLYIRCVFSTWWPPGAIESKLT